MCRNTVLLRAILATLLLSAQAVSARTPAPYPNTAGFGVPFAAGEEWHRQCMRVATLRPPLSAVLPPARGKTAKKRAARCDATDLYYRKRDQENTTDAEWREVQACARASSDDAVLMMLYANGYGQMRDADRAIQHACRLDSAKAEMEGRVAHLASGALNTDSIPFDVCDHATSDHMRSFCADLRDMRVERAYGLRLDRLAEHLPPSARKPFARLRKAAAVFVRQSTAETFTAAGGGAYAVEHAARRRDEFMQTVLDAAGGKIPPATPAEFEQLDSQLDAHYHSLMASAPDPLPGRSFKTGLVRTDLRVTQKTWLAYRDAWLAYLAAGGARVDAVSLQAILTRQRIAQLDRL